MNHSADMYMSGRFVQWAQHPGWSILWTGWKQMADRMIIVGQWVAWRTDSTSDEIYYSSCPGMAGKGRAGDIFNCSRQPGQKHPMDQAGLRMSGAEYDGYVHALCREEYCRLEEFMEDLGAFATSDQKSKVTIGGSYTDWQKNSYANWQRYTRVYTDIVDKLFVNSPLRSWAIAAPVGDTDYKITNGVSTNNNARESIRHEPIDNMPIPVQTPKNRKLDPATGRPIEEQLEISIDTESLVKYRCVACRAEDLDERDTKINPRTGLIFGCWHCSGKKLEKIG